MNASRQHRRRQSGHVIITVSIAAVVLIAFVGLAIDAGFLQNMKRRMQTAADAAALGGAQELARNKSDAIAQAKALDDALLNNYPSPETVVNIAPPGECAEAVVTKTQAPFFMRILNAGDSTVRARAVACVEGGNGCMYALSKTASPAFKVAGGALVNTPNCEIMVNSCANGSVVATGGGTVIAESVKTCGTYTQNGGGSVSPTPVPGQVPGSDPLKLPSLVWGGQPPIYDVSSGTQFSATSAAPLSPGIYCNGISVASGQNVQLNEGVYILAGGGLKSTGGSITSMGHGVTFYNTDGADWGCTKGNDTFDAITITAQTKLNLTAYDTGNTAGVLFYQDPKYPTGNGNNLFSNKIEGSPDSYLNGVLYFPKTDLTFGGNSATSATGEISHLIIIASTITLDGQAVFDNKLTTLPPGVSIKVAVLVE